MVCSFDMFADIEVTERDPQGIASVTLRDPAVDKTSLDRFAEKVFARRRKRRPREDAPIGNPPWLPPQFLAAEK